jgi:hypothetical protein
MFPDMNYFPDCPSFANDARNILRIGERQRTSGRPVCLSAPRDITRCVEPSLVVRARRATPVAGTRSRNHEQESNDTGEHGRVERFGGIQAGADQLRRGDGEERAHDNSADRGTESIEQR